MKSYIYIGHGTCDGVLVFKPGEDNYWTWDMSDECPLSWDILSPLGNYRRLPLSLSMEDICTELNRMFQFVEVIQYEQIPAYCKSYIAPLKKFGYREIRSCYPELEKLVHFEGRDFKKFTRAFESRFGPRRMENVNEIIKIMWEELQPFQYMGYYRDFVALLELNFKIS